MKKEISEEKQKYMKTVGQNIKRFRMEQNLSQEQLANLCGHTSNNARSWMSKIERGTNDPPTSELKLIAKALGVTCIDLMKEPEETDLERKTCELFRKCYGQEAFRMVQKFLQLDPVDQGRVEERIDTLLDNRKYKKESSKKQIC